VTIAKRVRDCRYAKGWGPDELATRAEISRTALYQIECGKTETPRAATLRRIARALDVSIESLLGTEEPGSTDVQPGAHSSTDGLPGSWPADRTAFDPHLDRDAPRNAGDRHHASIRERPAANRNVTTREGELQRKFRELLSSPLGEGLARIVEETHRLLPDIHTR
jgi:transcriptional regulator with XRE-family HTH domain